jgi:hypothetical protein
MHSTQPAEAQGSATNVSSTKNPYYSRTDTTVLHVSNAEWKKVLSPDVYAVAREKDTERAFTGKYWNFEGIGTYYCAACGNALFKSDWQNLRVNAVGPAFSKPFVLHPLPTRKIIPITWNASK